MSTKTGLPVSGLVAALVTVALTVVPPRTCEECGDVIKRAGPFSDGTFTRPSHYVKRRFCSRMCANRYNNRERRLLEDRWPTSVC